VKKLDTNICALAEFGHANVLDYPWGLFLLALDRMKKYVESH